MPVEFVEGQMVQVVVWVCPTPGCGNYYAASSAGDLREQMNTNAKGEPTFSRADCPDCRQRGQQVAREPHVHLHGLEGEGAS